MQPLAIIEHDAAFASRLRGALESDGFRTETFSTAESALPRLLHREFALAFIDLGLDAADPFSLCREASPITPVIAVNRGPAQELCMRALDAGADDCICHRVTDREVVARVRNLLRRAQVSYGSDDRLTTVVSEMRVRVADHVHDLTLGETAVLTALLDRAPSPMTVLDIAHAIGAKRGTVESRIKSLRKKLGPGRLVSRGRFGYQLEG